MYVDSQFLFSDSQAVTSAVGSTNTIDLTSARDIGTGRTLYVVVSIATILTDGGSNTGTTVALEGDSTTTFTPDATQTLFTIAQAAAAGTMYIAALDPGSAPLQFRYIRLKFTPTGADLTGGTIDAFIALDVQKYVSYAKGYTIS